MSLSLRVERQGATLKGFIAILLWSCSLGLMRSITESFGALVGGALIYSVSAVLIMLFQGVPNILRLNRVYLFGCGFLFVAYELMLSQAIGRADSHLQSIELGLLNYAWPCLTILFAVLFGFQKNQLGLWLGALISFAGVFLAIAGGELSPILFLNHMLENPIAYSFAASAALAWALYCNLVRRHGGGQNAIFYFFVIAATTLWSIHWAEGGSPIMFHLNGCLELLMMGLCTALGYAFWDVGIQKGNMTMLASASYFTPLFSTFLSSWWLHIPLAVTFWYATLMVTFGSLICWYSASRSEKAASTTDSAYAEN